MRSLLLCALLAAAGCASPLHLTYDYGRAYTAVVTTQADLTRPSVSSAQYELYGVEAAAIRINVQTIATEAKTGDSELSNQVGQ
jgi:hypothetical protein